ncbi:Bicarbonate transport system permease protein CmpB [Lacunisphaera limnophila]|uniref:Bicarbonate transport system permease protein CmpB n=1 Tax=Lacunisphaera limnophila TaxID=1838286 RepID=A0A1D8AY14_9BACT|nr:ABC transporter permease [Lacunisphaera limnophila]AOS45783.1 Bicarbonate transport system permease protein CmpB [Lacunisphaera limnophila]
MKKLPPLLLWLLPVVSGATFVALWYAVRHFSGLQSWILPTPGEILAAAWHERTRLWQAAGSTAVGALAGFLLAGLSSFALALFLGVSRSLRASLYPWLLMLQMTPVIVLTPIIVLWAGPGLPGIITITWLISFFPVVANTTQGLISADQNHVALFRMANASRWQELLFLRLPGAMPYYLTGLRIAATLAPIGAIFGEYMVGNSSGGAGGLGFLVYSYGAQIKIPALFATALTSCALGFVFVAAISLLNWTMLHKWHDSFDRDDH